LKVVVALTVNGGTESSQISLKKYLNFYSKEALRVWNDIKVSN